ncbi:persephin-like [Elgaria multicarinata webbii]|uniref:persephin-like n=1 Tax=Elgaria multicarinata webbii TaxID=159646 RepID=UPI002FCCCF39
MGAPLLLCSLFLILLIHTVPSQPNEGKVREALRTRLETRTSKGASANATGLQNKPIKLRAKSIPSPARSRQKQHTLERRQEQQCQLRSLVLPVTGLGLGYNAEEVIRFQYCSGRCPVARRSCPYPRRNYDLALLFLLRNSKVPALGERCCRPVQFNEVAFMDDSQKWRVVEELVANACDCVG